MMNNIKLIDAIKDDASRFLFNKSRNALVISESLMLNEYIHDLYNPTWMPVIINNSYTGYIVSNVGEVKSESGVMLNKYSRYDNWYFSVCISGHGLKLVHRLVAQAFIPNPENKPQVNHKDGNKQNNWVKNLEWCTAKENSDHAWKMGLVDNSGEHQSHSKYTNKQIIQVCELLESREFDYSKIYEITGVTPSAISAIRSGAIWKTISTNYNIPQATALYTDETIKEVCKLLEDPTISHGEISERTGVNINTIKDIMKKTSYSRISDEYDIKPRINKGGWNPVSKYSNSQIRDVCTLLSTTDRSCKDIANITGVGISTVYDILHRRKWGIVSDGFNFDNRFNTSSNIIS